MIMVAASAAFVVQIPAVAGANSLPESTSLGGYEAVVSSTAADTVVATVVVPTVTCGSPSPDQSFTAMLKVGLVDSANGNVDQAAIVIQCLSGQTVPVVFGQFDVGTNVDNYAYAINAGDTIALEVSNPNVGGDVGAEASIDNLTRGGHQVFGALPRGDATEAVVGVSGATVPVTPSDPVTSFGLIHWDKVLVDGSPLASSDPQGSNLVRPNGTIVVTTSPLSPSGASFKNARLRSP
jgi:hypothetical protein